MEKSKIIKGNNNIDEKGNKTHEITKGGKKDKEIQRKETDEAKNENKNKNRNNNNKEGKQKTKEKLINKAINKINEKTNQGGKKEKKEKRVKNSTIRKV